MSFAQLGKGALTATTQLMRAHGSAPAVQVEACCALRSLLALSITGGGAASAADSSPEGASRETGAELEEKKQRNGGGGAGTDAGHSHNHAYASLLPPSVLTASS